jgi:hypothetical protein
MEHEMKTETITLELTRRQARLLNELLAGQAGDEYTTAERDELYELVEEAGGAETKAELYERVQRIEETGKLTTADEALIGKAGIELRKMDDGWAAIENGTFIRLGWGTGDLRAMRERTKREAGIGAIMALAGRAER